MVCKIAKSRTLIKEDLCKLINYSDKIPFVVVQWLSHVHLCSPMDCSSQAPPSFTISQSLLKLMSIELVMPSNHLILCCSLLLFPSVFPSIRVFPNESAVHIRWPKYWSFSIGPSNEYLGLIAFRIDWFDLHKR